MNTLNEQIVMDCFIDYLSDHVKNTSSSTIEQTSIRTGIRPSFLNELVNVNEDDGIIHVSQITNGNMEKLWSNYLIGIEKPLDIKGNVSTFELFIGKHMLHPRISKSYNSVHDARYYKLNILQFSKAFLVVVI